MVAAVVAGVVAVAAAVVALDLAERPSTAVRAHGAGTGPQPTPSPDVPTGSARDGLRSADPIRPSGTATPAPSGSRPDPATAGLTRYTDTFSVQHPYDLPASARFSVTGGVYNAWVLHGDKPHEPTSATGPRTEMRWAGNWTGTEHLWEGDVLVDPGTDGTCVMQIKANADGEAVYVNVQHGGNLYDGPHTLLATHLWGSWFHLAADFDPASGGVRIWVNHALVHTGRVVRSGSTQWYFKNGVYNVNGARGEAHFRNIQLWRR